jgi:flavorubredoxin
MKNERNKESFMKLRKMSKDVYWLGAIDWDRRLFDSLIPLPDGTSYNAYFIRGSEKNALLDTVDPSMWPVLEEQLGGIDKIDYVVSHHAEQDHSGSIPMVLGKFPDAQVLCSEKCKSMLVDHLSLPDAKIRSVADGETVPLGGKTLQFVYTPWVHWPETMGTFLKEDGILFSCDFFGSHLATTDLYAVDRPRVYESAKRYYAEIMMPFRNVIRKNLEKVERLGLKRIAPSHGPLYDDPAFIIEAYKDWISDTPKNEVVIPFISMHGSTRKMVDRLIGALAERGVTAVQFDLSVTDIGKLAVSLVDAATLVVGTPTVHVGPHPNAVYAAILANAIRPKLRFASVIGSYGWSTKVVESIASMIPNLKVEVIPPVLCKGYPREADFKALDDLAEAIAQKHKSIM